MVFVLWLFCNYLTASWVFIIVRERVLTYVFCIHYEVVMLEMGGRGHVTLFHEEDSDNSNHVFYPENLRKDCAKSICLYFYRNWCICTAKYCTLLQHE